MMKKLFNPKKPNKSKTWLVIPTITTLILGLPIGVKSLPANQSNNLPLCYLQVGQKITNLTHLCGKEAQNIPSTNNGNTPPTNNGNINTPTNNGNSTPANSGNANQTCTDKTSCVQKFGDNPPPPPKYLPANNNAG